VSGWFGHNLTSLDSGESAVGNLLKRKAILLLVALAVILALFIYWLLLLLGMERWAEIWLLGMLNAGLTVLGMGLIYIVLGYIARKRTARKLSRYQCPVCGTYYHGEVESCLNCGNRM
jgi:hypothetical protein